MHFIRNNEICIECGACAADCSAMRFGLIPQRTEFADPSDPRCERCGHCYSVCPSGAIRVVDEPALPGLLSHGDSDRDIAPGDIIELLARRRSERAFSDREVSREELHTLLAAAAQTPSGGNARTVECTVIADNHRRQAILSSIRAFYHRLLRLAESRMARAVVGVLLGRAAGAFLRDRDYRRRFVALVDAIDGGIDPVFYNAPLVLLFHSKALMPTPEEDAVMAAYNAALTATTLGLGTCFVSMAQKAMSASAAVRRTVGLAKGHRVLAVLAVGHPERTRLRPVLRPAIPADSCGSLRRAGSREHASHTASSALRGVNDAS